MWRSTLLFNRNYVQWGALAPVSSKTFELDHRAKARLRSQTLYLMRVSKNFGVWFIYDLRISSIRTIQDYDPNCIEGSVVNGVISLVCAGAIRNEHQTLLRNFTVEGR